MRNSNGIVVMVSGTGSLLEAMIEKKVPIKMVLADRQCRGLDIAKAVGIDTVLLDRKNFRVNGEFNREKFTWSVETRLLSFAPPFVAMAGFMTVLSPVIFNNFRGRLLNSHPSLLPAFKGESAVADALAAGVKVTGTTIHIATEKLDEGPILAQEAVKVMPGDTVESLWERIKVVERELYPAIIGEVASKF
jgi:formyltetrahydrofolate-dependent phosphoribosylglycinamide formyltransferase